MADIINLRQARKNKKRAAKDEKAAQNRLEYGRTKEEKLLTKARKSKADKDLDGKKLDD